MASRQRQAIGAHYAARSRSRGIVAAAAAVALLTNSARFASLGDSITQYGAGLATSVLAFSAGGALESYVAASGNFNIDIWGSDSNTNPGWNGGNNGVAGQTLSGIGQRAADVYKLAPDALFIQGGTNDNIGIGNYQATADAYTGMAAAYHALQPTKHVFIRSIWPKGPTQSTGSTVADQRRYNAALKAYCDANPTWCHYINVFDLVTNADGTPLTGVLQADDLHPTQYGGWVAYPAYRDAIEAVTDSSKTANRLADNFWPTGNMFANGSFAGSTAATGTGMSGTMPTGWTPSGLTLTTVVSSVEANADTGGQSWVLDITPPAGTGSETLVLTPAAFTPTANAWYKLWMEFECQNAGFYPYAQASNGVVGVDQPVLTAKTMTGQLVSGVNSGKVRSQASPLQHRAVSTAPTISITIPKGIAPYQVKIRRIYFGPTADPHTTWLQTALPVNTAPGVLGVSTGTIGAAITVPPGTWSDIPSAASVNGQIFKYAMYRDGVFVSNTYASGALSYTPVNADGGSSLTWTVAASNMAKGRSAPVAVTGAVAVANPAWKAERNFVANTHKTNGTGDGDSLLNLTLTRSTAGYDNLMTTLFAINVPRRTSAGLLIEPAYSFNSFPSLPDNTSTRWTKSGATITENGGATGPEGTIVSSRVNLAAPGNYIRNVTTSQSQYEHAVYLMKGTAGIIVDVNLTPANAATPNNTIRWTFTGGWDMVPIQAILAGNSSMQLNIINPADLSQGSITFDVAYAGLSKLGAGASTDKYPAPFPTTTAAATSGADAASETAPAGATAGIFTFDDNSKQAVAVTGGGTYNYPTNLNRRLIKSFNMI